MTRREMLLLALAGVVGCDGHRTDAPGEGSGPSDGGGRGRGKRPTSKPVVREWHMRPLPADEVNLIALGDWGSDGNKESRAVAKALAEYMGKIPTQFNGLISVGDNLYCKLKDTHDMNWQLLFEDMYDASKINCPWYCVLGNHDYEQDKPRVQLAYARENPQSRWKFPAKWYRVEFPEKDPMVSVLMLDSDYHKLTPARAR